MASIAAPRAISTNLDVPGDKVQTHPYTCNSCQVAFRNNDLQRSHMRTDWHRYNLKRRVASLPPISAEVFQEKVLTAQASSTAVAAKASFEKACSACQKLYYSVNAYENHLRGQRHRSRVAALAKEDATTDNGEADSIITSTFSLGEPINGVSEAATPSLGPPIAPIDPEAEEEFSKVVDSLRDTAIADASEHPSPVSRRPTRPRHSAADKRTVHPLSPEKGGAEADGIDAGSSTATPEIPSITCLFCNAKAASLDLNAEHMSKVHGLFIPEQKYLVDLDGLISWLWTQIRDEPHECLYCHKARHSAEAVQGHMRDAGHCKIAFEDEEDMIMVGQFYDFTSTYSDEEDTGMPDGVALEDGWEDDSDVGSEEADDTVDVDETQRPRRKRPNFYTRASDEPVILDEELHLPSGKIAGHRSLAKYYRQNLRDHPSQAERLEQQKLLEAAEGEDGDDTPNINGDDEPRNSNEDRRGRQLISRANGGQGLIGVTDAKKREIQAIEKKDVRRAQRTEKQYQWGVNKRANNQKHFRDPLLQ